MRVRLSLLPAFFLLCSIPIPASAQAGGSVVFIGTEVLPLGNATLSIGPPVASGVAPLVNNRLYVGNLSFSGSDGFSVQIGGGSGALISFRTPTDIPGGGEMEFTRATTWASIVCRIVMSGRDKHHPRVRPVGD
jgi:hypothetical protein